MTYKGGTKGWSAEGVEMYNNVQSQLRGQRKEETTGVDFDIKLLERLNDTADSSTTDGTVPMNDLDDF